MSSSCLIADKVAFIKSSIGAQLASIKDTTLAVSKKVQEVTGPIFAEVAYWGTIALGAFITLTAAKLILFHPITAIALGVVGGVLYRNRKQISYTISVTTNRLKDFLGIKRYQWFSKINDKIVLGGVPLANAGHLKKLQSEGVTRVLCLAEDLELKKSLFIKPVQKEDWEKAGIEIKYMPCENAKPMSVAVLNNAADFIHESQKLNKKVYIHCSSGATRAPSALIAYLMKYENLSRLEAKKLILKERPSIHFSLEQLGRLAEYEDLLTNLRKTT